MTLNDRLLPFRVIELHTPNSALLVYMYRGITVIWSEAA